MDSSTSLATRAELSTFTAGSGTPALHVRAVREGPGPSRPDRLRRRGRLARGPGPEPRSASPPAAQARLAAAATPSSLPGPQPGLHPPGRSAARPPHREAPEAARSPSQAPPGPLSAPLPTPHALAGRALAERLRQLERGAPHLLGKVGRGEGAPLMQRVGQKPALGRRSNSPASRHLVSTVAAATERQPRQEEGGDGACS